MAENPETLMHQASQPKDSETESREKMSPQVRKEMFSSILILFAIVTIFICMGMLWSWWAGGLFVGVILLFIGMMAGVTSAQSTKQ